jgi:hypothetical protein
VHNTAELDNMFVHLTNVAIQKQVPKGGPSLISTFSASHYHNPRLAYVFPILYLHRTLPFFPYVYHTDPKNCQC